ncbi:MAG: TRAP transporter small permease [Bacillota bacterium]
MQRLINFVIKLEEFITIFLLGTIVLLVFLAAISRYLGSPINWSIDIAQALFVWVIYLGANQAWRNSKHIGVDFFVKRLNIRLRKCLELLVLAIILVFLILIIYNGVKISIINVGRILNDIPISYSFVTMAVPIGCLLIFMTTLSKSLKVINELKSLSINNDN